MGAPALTEEIAACVAYVAGLRRPPPHTTVGVLCRQARVGQASARRFLALMAGAGLGHIGRPDDAPRNERVVWAKDPRRALQRQLPHSSQPLPRKVARVRAGMAAAQAKNHPRPTLAALLAARAALDEVIRLLETS